MDQDPKEIRRLLDELARCRINAEKDAEEKTALKAENDALKAKKSKGVALAFPASSTIPSANILCGLDVALLRYIAHGMNIAHSELAKAALIDAIVQQTAVIKAFEEDPEKSPSPEKVSGKETKARRVAYEDEVNAVVAELEEKMKEDAKLGIQTQRSKSCAQTRF